MVKNVSKVLLGLFLGIMTVGVLTARVTSPVASTTPDRACWGPSGAEVCVDFSGNLVPTTDNDTTLGTSVLRWATAYIMDITVGDDLTVTDDTVMGGDLSLSGLYVGVPTTYTVGASTTITPTSNFGVITSTGGNLVWAGSPSISTQSFANGTLFSLMSSTTSDITVTDSTTLQLSTTATSTNRIFSNIGDTLVLKYLNSVWYEVSFSTGHE